MNVADEQLVLDYLYYGYVPQDPPVKWAESFFRPFDAPVVGTKEEVGRIFKGIMDNVFSNMSANSRCVVPLSGGWDSRLMLAAALERLDTRQIKTVSFGCPGELDFDLGLSLGRKVGVETTALDLRDVSLSWGDLVASARVAPWTYLPDSFFNDLSKAKVADNKDVVLTGFMGNPTTLENYDRTTNLTEATKIFVDAQAGRAGGQKRLSKLISTSWNLSLLPATYTPELSVELPVQALNYPAVNVLDILIRQANCTGPIVSGVSSLADVGPILGRCRASGGFAASPFAAPEWVNYWSNVPGELKRDRKLFLDFFVTAYPSIFNHPTKYSLGARSRYGLGYAARLSYYGSQYFLDQFSKKRRRFKAKMNYIDYAGCFRRRDDYAECLARAQKVIETVVSHHIDFDTMRKLHQSGKADYSTEFLLLIGAAANVEAQAIGRVR